MGNSVTKTGRKRGLEETKTKQKTAEKHQKQKQKPNLSEFIVPMKQEQDTIKKKKKWASENEGVPEYM